MRSQCARAGWHGGMRQTSGRTRAPISGVKDAKRVSGDWFKSRDMGSKRLIAPCNGFASAVRRRSNQIGGVKQQDQRETKAMAHLFRIRKRIRTLARQPPLRALAIFSFASCLSSTSAGGAS